MVEVVLTLAAFYLLQELFSSTVYNWKGTVQLLQFG